MHTDKDVNIVITDSPDHSQRWLRVLALCSWSVVSALPCCMYGEVKKKKSTAVSKVVAVLSVFVI